MWSSFALTARHSLPARRSASRRPSCAWRSRSEPSDAARGQGETRWSTSGDLSKIFITVGAPRSAVMRPRLCSSALSLALACFDLLAVALGPLPGPGVAASRTVSEVVDGNFAGSQLRLAFLSIFANFRKFSPSRLTTDLPLCAAIITASRINLKNRAS